MLPGLAIGFGLLYLARTRRGLAERDGPDLVAFSRLDPKANTQYLERYIEIHAANRYAHYRNRSL
jgi:hypothetical protein